MKALTVQIDGVGRRYRDLTELRVAGPALKLFPVKVGGGHDRDGAGCVG